MHDQNHSQRADPPAPSPRMESDAGPVTTHPLSNDLTNEDLSAASAAATEEDDSGLDGVQRSVFWTVAPLFLLLAAAGAAVAAIMVDQWKLFLVGALAVGLYMVIVAMPVLLAAGTKAAQDESVREGDRPRRRTWRRGATRTLRTKAPPSAG